MSTQSEWEVLVNYKGPPPNSASMQTTVRVTAPDPWTAANMVRGMFPTMTNQPMARKIRDL